MGLILPAVMRCPSEMARHGTPVVRHQDAALRCGQGQDTTVWYPSLQAQSWCGLEIDSWF
jgi:hypothetical protein